MTHPSQLAWLNVRILGGSWINLLPVYSAQNHQTCEVWNMVWLLNRYINFIHEYLTPSRAAHLSIEIKYFILWKSWLAQWLHIKKIMISTWHLSFWESLAYLTCAIMLEQMSSWDLKASSLVWICLYCMCISHQYHIFTRPYYYILYWIFYECFASDIHKYMYISVDNMRQIGRAHVWTPVTL